MMTREELGGFLALHNVKEGIDQQAFDLFVVRAAAGTQQVDVLLASGTPPVDGADGHISLSVPPTTEVHSGEEDVTSVDMHIVQTFINVSGGDEIGRIIPPEPGIPGRNILGLPIPPQPGKPLKCKIGKNILVEDDGARLIAATAGRFCRRPERFPSRRNMLSREMSISGSARSNLRALLTSGAMCWTISI